MKHPITKLEKLKKKEAERRLFELIDAYFQYKGNINYIESCSFCTRQIPETLCTRKLSKCKQPILINLFLPALKIVDWININYEINKPKTIFFCVLITRMVSNNLSITF